MEFDFEESDGLRNGAEIKTVHPGLAAEQAGLQAGDRITAIDGLSVDHPNRFQGITQAYPENATVTATVVRGEMSLEKQLLLEPIDFGATGITFKTPRNLKQWRELRQQIVDDPEVEIAFPIQKIDKRSAQRPRLD